MNVSVLNNEETGCFCRGKLTCSCTVFVCKVNKFFLINKKSELVYWVITDFICNFATYMRKTNTARLGTYDRKPTYNNSI